MGLDTARQWGWAYETACETSDIQAVNSLYWKFGVRTIDLKDLFPSETHDWQMIYKDKRNVQDSALYQTGVLGRGVGFYPTNGIPLFLVMGDSATAGAPEYHDITHLDTGALPCWTSRGESSGGTTDKIFEAVGCKAYRVAGMISLISEWPFLTESVQYHGIRMNTTTHQATMLDQVHTTGTKHPTDDYTMTGTEKSERYTYDANFSFTWDSDQFKTELAQFSYSIQNNMEVKFIENQTEPEYLNEGNYQFLFSFDLHRGGVEALWQDFLAETQKTMVLKIYNDTALRREYTWTNATLTQCDAPDAMGDHPKFYNVAGFAETLAIRVYDDVHASFYKD